MARPGIRGPPVHDRHDRVRPVEALEVPGVRLRVRAGKPVVLFRSDSRHSGDERDIPYNAMLIGAAEAHIELELATLDEAAEAILTTLSSRSNG